MRAVMLSQDAGSDAGGLSPQSTLDAAAWAAELGISREAVDLYQACEVIDLHVDTFIWTRIFGYDMHRRHGRGPLGARYFYQVDLPRALEAGLTGALWSITTNPYRDGASRGRVFRENLERLRGIVQADPQRLELVRDAAGYRRARAAGKHGAFLAVQGANAVDADDAAYRAMVEGGVVAVTLVHLSNSALGTTSSPLGRDDALGLRPRGVAMIEALNADRVFVDLAHISRRGFWRALEVHDRSQPLIVTHTGVSAVHRSWRNLDDEQLRAVADTGGTVGVIFHGGFLGGGYLSGGRSERIADHLMHIIETVGEDHASLGSDWDGMIITPSDMRTCHELPRLVQHLLDRGCSDVAIGKLLGGNYLRALAQLRG
ncbi:MAG: dipeptidase [Myxococcales bacterium]|nr:dipeptidase [Myxococcales bacterium]